MMKEQLGENDEWYCRRCQKHVRAFKKMDIWRLPPLLVFQLKRFTYEVGAFLTHREKIEGYVDFPFDIDMSPFVLGCETGTQAGISPDSKDSAGGSGKPSSGADSRRSLKYELVAVSNHMGGLGGGHYTAYAKRGDKWFFCNDSSISQTTADQVRTAQAYVLFYRLVKEDVGDPAATNGEASASGQGEKEEVAEVAV